MRTDRHTADNHVVLKTSNSANKPAMATLQPHTPLVRISSNQQTQKETEPLAMESMDMGYSSGSDLLPRANLPKRNIHFGIIFALKKFDLEKNCEQVSKIGKTILPFRAQETYVELQKIFTLEKQI